MSAVPDRMRLGEKSRLVMIRGGVGGKATGSPHGERGRVWSELSRVATRQVLQRILDTLDDRGAVRPRPSHRLQPRQYPAIERSVSASAVAFPPEDRHKEKKATTDQRRSLSLSARVMPSPPSSTVRALRKISTHLSRFSLCNCVKKAKLGASCTHCATKRAALRVVWPT